MDAIDGRPPIGGENRRIDAHGKVTGQTRYVGDILKPELLYARVLRSPYHHARLLSLEINAALQISGVVRVITSDDIPGVNGFPEYSHDEPLLTPVGDTLKSKGAPIALVVAETLGAAQAGLAAIEAEYEPLSHSFDPNQNDLPIYPGGNRLKDHQVIQGDIEATFSESDTILETRYTTSYQEHVALESESALGYLDEAGRVTVMGGTHEPHWQRNWIADTLDLPRDKVRFITPPTGGSFGGKQDPRNYNNG